MDKQTQKIHFGKRLRHFTNEKGMQGKELSKHLGFDSQSSMTRLFKEQDFNTKYLRKSAEVLGIQMIDFFENDKRIDPNTEIIDNLKESINFLQEEIRNKNDMIANYQQSIASMQMNFQEIRSKLDSLKS